ncbi:kumamolisin [Ktedonobacteria bacterium brp13]|nr:kumamolisin [Ktedonobacteria bacterium brp13]
MAEPFQNRVALPGSFRPAISEGKSLGAIDPIAVIEVSVYLHRPDVNPDSIVPRLGKPREQATVQASPEDIGLVEHFAQQHGLTVVRVVPEAYQVVLSGSAKAIKQAFQIETLERIETPSGPRRIRSGHIYIPKEWEGHVVAILGIDDRPQARTHFQRVKSTNSIKTTGQSVPESNGNSLSTTQSYAPVDIAKLYNFPPVVNGAGQCIALIELGGGYQNSDLQQFFTGLPRHPKVVAVSVDQVQNIPGGDPHGADGEVELDIEIAGSCAPGANIAVYFAPNTDRGFVDAINQAIHDQVNKPNIISISWGAPDVDWTAQSKSAMDQAFQAAGLLGVTICCAAGDQGASDGVNDGTVHVDYPASSPYVLACGGTSLNASVGQHKITSEMVWNDGPGSATGGGVSADYPVPQWQMSIQPTSVATGNTGRGVPDVSGDADPRTGYQVFIDGTSELIGGTSAVAPLWAALIARFNQALHSSIGFINPLLYQNYTQIMQASGLYDITQGNNNTGNGGGYSARQGWDACTGLGSPSGTQLLNILKTLSPKEGEITTL